MGLVSRATSGSGPRPWWRGVRRAVSGLFARPAEGPDAPLERPPPTPLDLSTTPPTPGLTEAASASPDLSAAQASRDLSDAQASRDLSDAQASRDVPDAPHRHRATADDVKANIQRLWHDTQLYVDAGQYQDAVQMLERATALAPEQADLHNALAQCLMRVGRTDQATHALHRAAEAARAQGQTAWAEELLETAQYLHPENPEAQSALQSFAGTLPAMKAPGRPPGPSAAEATAGPATQPSNPSDAPSAWDRAHRPPEVLDLSGPVTERDTPPVLGPELVSVPETSHGPPLSSPEVVFQPHAEADAGEQTEDLPLRRDPPYTDRDVASAFAKAFNSD